MSPAETFRLVVLKNPDGFTLSDVFYIEGNRRRPVFFKKAGEVIDLERVDVKSFVRSSLTGSLAELQKSGTLMKVQMEVSVRKTMEIEGEIRAQTSQPSLPKGAGSTARVIILEPGVQVAVGDGGIGLPPNGSGKQLEPGVYAPGGEPKGQPIFAGVSTNSPTSAEDTLLPSVKTDEGIAAVKSTGGASLDDATGPAGNQLAPQEPPAPPNWKDNKTLKEQEEFIFKSTDKVFLQSVIDDESESKKLKNLAKKVLAELS